MKNSRFLFMFLVMVVSISVVILGCSGGDKAVEGANRQSVDTVIESDLPNVDVLMVDTSVNVDETLETEDVFTIGDMINQEINEINDVVEVSVDVVESSDTIENSDVVKPVDSDTSSEPAEDVIPID